MISTNKNEWMIELETYYFPIFDEIIDSDKDFLDEKSLGMIDRNYTC